MNTTQLAAAATTIPTKPQAVRLWDSTDDVWVMRRIVRRVPVIGDREWCRMFSAPDADWVRANIHPKWECYSLLDYLGQQRACALAKAWILDAGITSLDEAWAKCNDTEWMHWMLLYLADREVTVQYTAAITVLNNGRYIDQEACDMARSLCPPIWKARL